jgi:uncharacterized membrane protein YraQ (UPF0718 family)
MSHRLLASSVLAQRAVAWREGYRGVSTATLIAMPSMMCTCCAAPVAVGSRQTGASPLATLAYWVNQCGRQWLAGFFRLAASLIPEYLALILLLGCGNGEKRAALASINIGQNPLMTT